MSARNFYTDHRIASSLEERSFDHHYLDIKNVNCFPSDKVLKIKFPSLGSFSYFATKPPGEVVVDFNILDNDLIKDCSTREAFKRTYAGYTYRGSRDDFDDNQFSLLKRKEGNNMIYFGHGIIIMDNLPIFVAIDAYLNGTPAKKILLTDKLFTKFSETNKFVLQTLIPQYLRTSKSISVVSASDYDVSPLFFSGTDSIKQTLLDHADDIVKATE